MGVRIGLTLGIRLDLIARLQQSLLFCDPHFFDVGSLLAARSAVSVLGFYVEVSMRFSSFSRLSFPVSVRRVALAIGVAIALHVNVCPAQAQSAQQWAQIKSQRMASLGIRRLIAPPSENSIAPYGMRHVYPLRRPWGTARREGVGYSPFSASEAIRNACFYGRRPIVASAVVRGRDGYYATVYYK